MRSRFWPVRFALLALLATACSEGAVLIGEVRSRPTTQQPGSSSPPPPRDLDAGSTPDSASWPTRFECRTTDDIHYKIFRPKCGVCHGDLNNPAAANLILTSGDVRQRIIDRRSECDGRPLITFNNGYVGGHFFHKLDGPVPGCGGQMPFGAIAPLNQGEIDCLRTWFQTGLPPGAEPLPPAPDLDAAAPADARTPPGPPALRCESDDIQEKVLTPKCSVCHGTNMPASDLDLRTPGVRQRLLDGRSRCDRPFVTFTNGYVGGHLFDKLAGAVPGCGNQMPFGGIAPLSPTEIDCLRAWFQPGTP